MTTRAPLLEARQLVTGFGATQVLHGIDLVVRPGETHGVFGLNGAGKSVTMKCLSGLLPLWSGSVTIRGDEVAHLSAARRVALGIGNVPQGRQVFPELTVEENLRLGALTSRRRDRASWPDRLARTYGQLPVLKDKRSALAGTLSGGQQASLAIGRALVNDPAILLIDEPSAGLAPVVVSQLDEVLRAAVAASGVAMVLVEQNVAFGLGLVDTAHLLQSGQVVHTGPVSALEHDLLVRSLGIGRMLGAGTSAALGRTAPTRRRRTGGRRVPLRAHTREAT